MEQEWARTWNHLELLHFGIETPSCVTLIVAEGSKFTILLEATKSVLIVPAAMENEYLSHWVPVPGRKKGKGKGQRPYADYISLLLWYFPRSFSQPFL